METKKADNKREHVTEFDPNKLRLDVVLSAVARYPDKTWGGKVQSIIINGLPDPAFFDRITADADIVGSYLEQERKREANKIYLTIEGGKATLSQRKTKPINKNLNEGCVGCGDLGVSCAGYRKEHETEKAKLPCYQKT